MKEQTPLSPLHPFLPQQSILLAVSCLQSTQPPPLSVWYVTIQATNSFPTIFEAEAGQDKPRTGVETATTVAQDSTEWKKDRAQLSASNSAFNWANSKLTNHQ